MATRDRLLQLVTQAAELAEVAQDALAVYDAEHPAQPGPDPDPPPPPPPPPPPVATSIVVSGPAALTVGQTATYAADVRDQHGHPMAAAIIDWRVLPGGRAIMTPQGVVTALEAGLVSVIAAVDTVSHALLVTLEAAAEPAPPPPPPPTSGAGIWIWISPAELVQRPTSGAAWSAVLSAANSNITTPNLSNQDDKANVLVLAAALVYARTGTESYRTKVLSALTSIVNSGTYNGRALALGRELGAYVIAADLVSLKTANPALDQAFRAKIKALLRTSTSGGPGSLVESHEKRPNNWGTHAGGARAAVAAYLGDTAELARCAQVFRGWLGDRDSYAGFSYGDLAWQALRSAPVGINPAGATIQGRTVDGVLPDDQRRGGGFTWPPPKENYVWEGLQGALMQAVILHRAGYPAFEWEDRALLRAVTWLYTQAAYPAAGDDTWMPHLVNHHYGTSFPGKIPSSPGKNVGYTDWTHAR